MSPRSEVRSLDYASVYDSYAFMDRVIGYTIRSEGEVPISDIVVPVSIGVSVSGSNVPLAYQSLGPENHYSIEI